MSEETTQGCEIFPKTCDKGATRYIVVSDDASFAFSVFYGMFVVMLTVVFKVSQHVKPSEETIGMSDYYLNILFFVSILWFVLFGASVTWGCNKNDAKEPVKSYHASNRWLKGVVALFGFSIVIKDALELIALAEITNPLCRHKMLYVFAPILHCPYVFGQVAFLFLYAKIHIQECRHLSRLGIMHIMATNLSVWISTVASETNSAITYAQPTNFDYENETEPLLPHVNGHSLDDPNFSSRPPHQEESSLFHGNCTCTTAYCDLVIQADKFLFPFLIEFCLISTCLLYVSWRKVGKKSVHHHSIVKPSYRFYKAYKGPTLGALVLAVTITVIVILGALNSETPHQQKSYMTESEYLHLYEAFLVACETINFLACILGFYLYNALNKKKALSSEITLDMVLLFVCFTGPLLVGLFSILAMSTGASDSKAPGWLISLVYPFTDIFGSLVQILFIVYGLQRVPTPASSLRKHRKTIDVEGATNTDGNSLLQMKHACDSLHLQPVSTAETSMVVCRFENNQQTTTPALATSLADDQQAVPRANTNESATTSAKRSTGTSCSNVTQLNLKASTVASSSTRVALRDVIMFLMFSNASIWIFLSLDKTVFSTLTYQYYYFGHSAWTIITAVTSPFSIFLRMHSAACFFEMWSYV